MQYVDLDFMEEADLHSKGSFFILIFYHAKKVKKKTNTTEQNDFV